MQKSKTSMIHMGKSQQKDHYFEQISRSVSFAAEITAFIEPRRMKKVTGVKAKELLLWIGVSEMLVDNSNSGNIQFKTHTGISRSFPVSAFMVSQVIDSMRERAEICVGEIECQKRAIQLLDEFNIPRGLLPLENIVEIGLVPSEGFIWLRQKKKKDHYFEQIGRSVSFAAEVTAFIEPRRMKKVTGVKAKELLL
ncbi:hypothetical protein EJ110_NYTH32650 [Nymphaea thermarum]|nr:hypothetical protein EJ110_NYTH32650 [Nymphaea thermarum]